MTLRSDRHSRPYLGARKKMNMNGPLRDKGYSLREIVFETPLYAHVYRRTPCANKLRMGSSSSNSSKKNKTKQKQKCSHLLETSSGKGLRKVLAVRQRVDLHAGLVFLGQHTLHAFHLQKNETGIPGGGPGGGQRLSTRASDPTEATHPPAIGQPEIL